MTERYPPDTRWRGKDGSIGEYIRQESQRTLEAYGSQPTLVAEQANQEQDTARGGYANRQIIELVQNGADQLSQITEGGRMEIRLARDHLYCADAGAPIDEDGAKALLFSHLSPKRGTLEIGRFGVGFKSILGVANGADFFSRSGSFRFDRQWAEARIRQVVRDATRFPVLRIAEPMDTDEATDTDPLLRNLMQWATNIVRLPLHRHKYDALANQMRDFRPEFLLFAPHVRQLDLDSYDGEVIRTLKLKSDDGQFDLCDGERTSQWRVFRRVHKLSDEAKADARTLDNPEEVELKWAAPLESRSDIQHFWAFFPTMTNSLLTGILNAPWKTNEDRHNLLGGPYNEELIDAAAKLVADHLRHFSNSSDPAKHLDILPRRRESGDNDHANRLRTRIYKLLSQREMIPDQGGVLRRLDEIHYPPAEFISGQQRIADDALKIWTDYEHRPSDWLHHCAVTVNRLGVIDRIIQDYDGQRTPRASVAGWLEALVQAGKDNDDAVSASRTAIVAAATLPEHLRSGDSLGKIVLTASNGWAVPAADSVFLSVGTDGDPSTTVHPDLEADPDTLKDLDALGVKPLSAESLLRNLAKVLSQIDADAAENDPRWAQLWLRSRSIDPEEAKEIIDSHFKDLFFMRVKTVAQVWKPLNEVLLPGPIVPSDGSRDEFVAVDVQFHNEDLPLLNELDVTDQPCNGYKPSENYLQPYLDKCRKAFQHDGENPVGSRPQSHLLKFICLITSGPLEVFRYLSKEGCVQYTEALLNLDTTFLRWTMKHHTQPQYGKKEFPSPAIHELRKRGRISVDDRIVPFADGLGKSPKNPEVQRRLLEHANTRRIRQAFKDLVSDFSDDAEPIGDEEAIPLLDVWPGLTAEIGGGKNLSLVRCGRIVDTRGTDVPSDCVRKGHQLYLIRRDDERMELEAIIRELDLDLKDDIFESILRRDTPQDVKSKREEVRRHETDAERLLAAVGEERLLARLPETLIDILGQRPEPFTGVRVAEAAIATFHTGALKEYRRDILHLGPPHQWAGGDQALAFVKALGFDREWAGRRTPKREPFLDVPGPRSLPDLHGYQRTVVDNVKAMLRGASGENRGLVSMPTGSGKTRVAVQAVIETIRDQELCRAVLWVADRDELCEQAVEAWRQAWASIGAEAGQLRIARWWSGQPQPEARDGSHVVVATIQTLRSRIEQEKAKAVLADVRLLVVDEAHGSIAPSYTQLMGELGLTFRRGEDEPFLLGLTATPYRGRDEDETQRLVNRYGHNRLDAGAFESDDPKAVVAELQKMTVLAEADHAVIEGIQFELSDAELHEIEEKHLPWLPESVEQRIAGDMTRTQGIVDAYRKQVAEAIGTDAPTLIFATSVAHAQTIAAMLELDGAAARAVSGETDTAVRRSAVEQFRSGEIKVLVNYGVFREGFDAPKTRAIIVARPVYSPNLYFQMIGRGLRGELNGGSDRCLILDVEDNIENYDRALAFSELDWLWDR